MSEEIDARRAHGAYLFEDSLERIRYQHEFALAGLRTLVLINGGAIIALLTYAGSVEAGRAASQLQGAFFCYVAGLVVTTGAYLFAYISQAAILQSVRLDAKLNYGLIDEIQSEAEGNSTSLKRGNCAILAAIAMAVLGLIGFLAGSILAMGSLSYSGG